jgi:hypothetical protein
MVLMEAAKVLPPDEGMTRAMSQACFQQSEGCPNF